jgi:hypothetical protein
MRTTANTQKMTSPLRFYTVQLARVIAILATGWGSLAQAGVAEDVSILVFTELRFSRNAMAIVAAQGCFR